MENEAMEIMENVADAIVEDNNTVTEPAYGEATGANIGTALVRTFVIGGALLGAYLYVKKDKIKKKVTEHRIKKLQKDGYVVLAADEIIDETHEECVEDVVD